MKKAPTISMRRRTYIVLTVIILCFCAVVRQLYIIQFIDGNMYKQKALAQQLKTTNITPNRGNIYDRNGNILAESETVWDVLFSPADVTDEQAELIADGMNEIFGIEREVILKKASDKTKYYKEIKKRVPKEQADAALKFAADNNIKGIYLEETTKRSYPYDTLASSVLGFVNAENRGAYGIEAYFNETLSGVPGRVVTAKNAKGREMSFRYQDVYNSQDGKSIVTTLDATVQQILEKNLRAAVIEHGVKNRAAGIFMDITNGEILAMVTMPDFDPNHPNEVYDKKTLEDLSQYENDPKEYNKHLLNAQFSQWKNKCITEPYEPGSVFKIVTLAAGLETGVIKPSDTFYCPGYHMVGKVKKSCWKLVGHGSQTLAQAVQNSCNPAFMMIGERIGAEKFYDFFEAFGLTEQTGIPLPGEAESIYHSKKALMNPLDYENSLTSCAFGQTFKVTPIQLITAVAAACNGGYLYEPTLVKRIVDAQGNIVSETNHIPKRQVISESTSRLVCEMLETVVSEGSGRNSYISGYRVGGKTGTSEKIDLEHNTGKKEHILSFVGVAPMDDPKYACLVLLDEPSLINAYGSTIAAPIVGAVLAEALPYLGVEKKYTAEELEKADRRVNNYIGFGPHAARSALEKSDLTGKIIGYGKTVIKQVPSAGTMVPRNGTVLLYTEEPTESTLVQVPDVRGKSGMEANRLIINSGLNIRVNGVSFENQHAVAASQDILGGTEVEKGTVITVDFVDKNMTGFAP